VASTHIDVIIPQNSDARRTEPREVLLEVRLQERVRMVLDDRRLALGRRDRGIRLGAAAARHEPLDAPRLLVPDVDDRDAGRSRRGDRAGRPARRAVRVGERDRAAGEVLVLDVDDDERVGH